MAAAPIALFVYNRPEHTRRTLESLSRVRGFHPERLTVFADGPPPAASKALLEAVARTREVVKAIFPKTTVVESPTNLGLGHSILRGVGKIFERHEDIIVIEDDLIFSPGFLEYMDAALAFYRDEPRVMHVSGFMFPVDVELPETFFYRPTTCWGWATWKNKWQKIIADPVELYRRLWPKKYAFNLEGVYDFFSQIENNAANGLETWAILWQATVFLENGLSLHPGRSLVSNDGMDGSGENSSVEDRARPSSLAESVRVEKIPLVESKEARAAMRRFYLKQRAPWPARKRYEILSRIPLEVRRYVQSLVVPSKIKIRRELNRLEREPRHVPGVSTLFGPPFAYVDAKRLAGRYKQYFLSERILLPPGLKKPRFVVTLAEEGTLLKYLLQRYPDAQILAFDPLPEHQTALKNNGFEAINALADVKNGTETVHVNGVWAGRPVLSEIVPTLVVAAVNLNDYLQEPVDLLVLHRSEILAELCLDHVARIWVEWSSDFRRPQTLSQILSVLENAGFRYTLEALSSPHSPFLRHKPMHAADGVYRILAKRR